MIRRAAISILVFLSLATAAAWVAGLIARTYYLSADFENHALVLRVNGGQAEIAYFNMSCFGRHGTMPWGLPYAYRLFPPLRPDMFGYGPSGKSFYYWKPRLSTMPQLTAIIGFPLWAPLLIFGTYPLIALIFSPYWRRRLRRERGLCLHCGYDLTGNVTNVCPECGTQIEDRATSTK
ncbi:MAG: hypothetical protein JSV78_08045 [Phycisphaerales bacterium]|nr:MAG: hypothetical protein JSV78_08045 [Phycisphaerales bacterium]